VARAVHLHRRDLAILELLVERRAETLEYLHGEFYPSWTLKSARSRLGALAKAGYLERTGVPLPLGDRDLESVYTLGPKAKRALELRSIAGAHFRGRRFNPTLRASSLPHQIATNRVADWLGAELQPEHLLPARGAEAARHRPDGVYEAAARDAQGRGLVFLEVDLGHYTRERLLGKVRAFLDDRLARSIVIVSPDRDRSRLVSSWVRDAYGEAIIGRVQPLTFAQVLEGGYLRDGTEPAVRLNEGAPGA
jgi:hypothetical protein